MGIGKSGLNIFLMVSFLIIIVGIEPAFAHDIPDTGPWIPAKNNYANIGMIAPYPSASCPDADKDGICDSWEPTVNPGLKIDFTDSSTGVRYQYNLLCNTNARYDPTFPTAKSLGVPVPTPNNPTVPFYDPAGELVCPDINVPDVYVELDWMKGHTITSTAIKDIVSAYHNMTSPVNLHIVNGESAATTLTPESGEMIYGGVPIHYCIVRTTLTPATGALVQSCPASGPTGLTAQQYQSYPLLKQNFFGTVNERPESGANFDSTACPNPSIPTSGISPPLPNDDNHKKSYNCLTAKRQVFHYALVANFQFGTANYPSSGWGEIPGNDLLITLAYSTFTNGIGNNDEQESAIMHELGHNYGLNHGGGGGATNTPNCKPNYLSVMNYLYEFRKNDSCRPLAYSSAKLADLNEAGLQDSNVGSYPYPSWNPAAGPDGQGGSCPISGERKIFWAPNTIVPPATTGPNSNPNDWNGNGISTATYSQDLNYFASSVSCNVSPGYTTLTGFDDINYLFNGQTGYDMYPFVFRVQPGFTGTPAEVDQGETSGNHIDGGPVLASITSVPTVIPPPPPVCTTQQLQQGWTIGSDNTCVPPICTTLQLQRDWTIGSDNTCVPPPVCTTQQLQQGWIIGSDNICHSPPSPPSNCCCCDTSLTPLLIGLIIAILIIVIIILLLRIRP